MSQDTITRTTHTITSSDGTTIAYEKTGTGPAVVIVDGALCYREFGPARALAEALAPNYTAYFYDRRGRGESGDTQPYAVQREIEDLAAIIAAAGGDAYVFGQSSGAGIALEAAASGVRMRKLAVYEAPYVGLAGDVDHVAKLQSYLTDDKRGAAVGHFMVKMVGAPAFVPLMMRLMPKVWKQLRGVAHTLPNDAMVMDGFNVPTARLGTITVPTLVMGGSKGAENMKAAVRGVAEAVPGSQQRTLDGQTHQVSEQALLPELREFFR
ncbi:MAG: alpha/beta hydrolase [Microbacteriaceae bacterium]|jgi:pimeloyl-ACP methyl ester carboxylesterase|nr:alpha/beta hydrolase [Microbacteriaceae bacterium]